MDLSHLRAHYGSVMQRDGALYVLDQYAQNPRHLQARANRIAGAFITWEARGITLPGGRRVGACFALWVLAPMQAEAEPEPADSRRPSPGRSGGRSRQPEGRDSQRDAAPGNRQYPPPSSGNRQRDAAPGSWQNRRSDRPGPAPRPISDDRPAPRAARPPEPQSPLSEPAADAASQFEELEFEPPVGYDLPAAVASSAPKLGQPELELPDLEEEDFFASEPEAAASPVEEADLFDTDEDVVEVADDEAVDLAIDAEEEEALLAGMETLEDEKSSEDTAEDGVAPAPAKKRRGPKTTRYKNITRIDHPPRKTYGYFVRVRWQNIQRSKFFSDHKYGDRLAALAAAIEWRDEIEREMGKPRTEQPVIGITHGSSGIIGVRRRLKDGAAVYEATWVENGKVHRTSYSVRKYGERRAMALAIKIRKEKERARLKEPRSSKKLTDANPQV